MANSHQPTARMTMAYSRGPMSPEREHSGPAEAAVPAGPPPYPLERASSRTFAPVLPLVVALVLACVMYAPAIPSGLYGDDYAYLLAQREMGFGDFVAAALDPREDDTLLHLPGGYWRPLSSLSWQVTAPLFGANGAFYHLLTLAIHLASVVVVWLLARRIAGGTVGPAAAAILVAIHPASIEAVAWASSINSAALPVALAAWLALARAVRDDEPQPTRWLLVAAGSLSIALLFRETVAVIAVAASLWYLVVSPPPWRSRTARGTVRWTVPIVAMAAPVVAYLVVSTVFFTQSASGNRVVWSWDGVENWGFYIRYVGVPIGPPAAAYVKVFGAAVGAVLLLLIPATVVARRPVVAALLVGFVVALVPYAFVDIGTPVRYLYFPLAPLALGLAALIAAFEEPVLARWRNAVPAATALLVLVAIPVAVYGSVRVDRWVTSAPGKEDAWLEQVTGRWPTWPHEGGRLFAANTPFMLGIFGGFALQPALEYVYDGQAPEQVIVIAEEDIPRVQFIVTEQDEIFVFEE